MTDFDSLREDLHALNEATTSYAGAVNRHVLATNEQVRRLWADNAELRDELHALANRVEALTRARLTEPAEVAEKIVSRYHCICGALVTSDASGHLYDKAGPHTCSVEPIIDRRQT